MIVSQFTDLYYYVDSRNFYNRGSMYWLSTLIPAVGMLIDFFVIIQYRKMIGPRLSLAMCSYILMPLVAALVQLFSIECTMWIFNRGGYVLHAVCID